MISAFNQLPRIFHNSSLKALLIALFLAFLPSGALAEDLPMLDRGSDNRQISQNDGLTAEPSHEEKALPVVSTESISHLNAEIKELKTETEKLNSSLLALEKHTEAELERNFNFLLFFNMILYLSIVVSIIIRRFM